MLDACKFLAQPYICGFLFCKDLRINHKPHTFCTPFVLFRAFFCLTSSSLAETFNFARLFERQRLLWHSTSGNPKHLHTQYETLPCEQVSETCRGAAWSMQPFGEWLHRVFMVYSGGGKKQMNLRYAQVMLGWRISTHHSWCLFHIKWSKDSRGKQWFRWPLLSLPIIKCWSECYRSFAATSAAQHRLKR